MPKSFDDDESGFMQSLKGIRKLDFDRVDLNQQKPKGQIRVPSTESSSALNSFNASERIPPATPEQWFQHGVQKKLQRKIRMGLIPVDATLDLHGYRQQQAIDQLYLFLQQALSAQLRFVLIIHGKGFRSESQAIIRPLVQHWLQQQPNVLAFCPAQPRDGGSGASYVYLKNH